jgi:Kef-type K+ transport system membrane component KefB
LPFLTKILHNAQVETLAQFGIIFLLFALGVEFSFSKLRHVQGSQFLVAPWKFCS